MMKLAKYKNFLLDKNLYLQNRNFWNDTVSSLSEADFEEWVITTFANGEDFFDGNPIFSALYERQNKAVRIIQLEKDAFTPELRVWLENVQINTKLIRELVIVIQTSDQAFQSVKSIITAFLNDIPITKYIANYNTFYKSKANQARVKSAISSFEKAKWPSENRIFKQPDKPKKSASGQLRVQ